jgi:hypothetical protein
MQFNRFGNMAPPIDMMVKSYKLIKEQIGIECFNVRLREMR